MNCRCGHDKARHHNSRGVCRGDLRGECVDDCSRFRRNTATAQQRAVLGMVADASKRFSKNDSTLNLEDLLKNLRLAEGYFRNIEQGRCRRAEEADKARR